MTTQERVQKIMASDTMTSWAGGVATNVYGGGLCYKLYLDLDDDTLFIDCQADCNTWRERSDGSLIHIASYQNPDDEKQELGDDWFFDATFEIEQALWDAIDN